MIEANTWAIICHVMRKIIRIEHDETKLVISSWKSCDVSEVKEENKEKLTDLLQILGADQI